LAFPEVLTFDKKNILVIKLSI